MLDRYLLLGIFLPADGGIFFLFFFIIFMFNIVLIIITGISQFLHFINAVYWCSFCKDPERLRCNDDPWEVEGLKMRGVSTGEDVSEVDELNEVARLCMLRDLESLALSNESLVT